MRTITAGKVLVVEDHVELAENLVEILAGWGFVAISASKAEDGLRMVEEDPSIGIVVADHRLPGVNGVQLIAELRRRGRGIRCVLISVLADNGLAEAARAAGATAVLGKPIDLRRLRASLSDAAQGMPTAD